MKRFLLKPIALVWLCSLLVQLFSPMAAFALTSGPSQPEVHSFEPVGTTDMVDLFTGDFTYNIPLFELPGPNGGYPFNMAYHSGISMDMESSWTGLGWNLNPGVITRQMRGLPDDFDGDKVKKKQDMRTMWTVGLNSGANYELFGADGDKISGSLGLSAGVYYNNYRGIGYNLGAGLNFQVGKNDGIAAGLGMNLNLDSQEGAGLNPSLSLSSSHKDAQSSYNLGLGYNSKSGVESLSFAVTLSSKPLERHQIRQNKAVKGRKNDPFKGGASFGGGSSISFAKSAHSPSIGQEMRGSNISLNFKIGVSAVGNFASFSGGGYYSEQHLKYKNEYVAYKGYGYHNLQNADKEESHTMLDFNREKEGAVRPETPNLPIPHLTYDIYNGVGQGVAGMFRPYRSDVGALYDPPTKSVFGGGSGGVDIGPSITPHMGGDVTFNATITQSGPWDNNSVYKNFSSSNSSSDYETYYFKVRGEYISEKPSSYNHIGGNNAVRIQRNGIKELNDVLINQQDVVLSTQLENTREERMPRNTAFFSPTNAEIGGNNTVLPEFDVRYYSSSAASFNKSTYGSAPETRVEREEEDGHSRLKHMAGFTTLDPTGSRYVYGLPIYNTKQVENIHSTEHNPSGCGKTDTDDNENAHQNPKFRDQFLSVTEMPPYAHSYMLTSILGYDYVDVDNNGPSDNDLGYWVKFDYVKPHGENNVKWRAPYIKENYDEGALYRNNDSKGSYSYGEKEVFYLATAQTKTHIAYFEISKRNDALGAIGEFKNNLTGIETAQPAYKLDKIKLYSKENLSGNPIMTIHLEYTYELCEGIENYNDFNDYFNEDVTIGGVDYEGGVDKRPGLGKLTLRKLWFTYESSNKGALSPYEFFYEGLNPDYNTHWQDRWGTYRPFPSSVVSGCPNSEDLLDSYTPQTDGDINDYSSAWHLTSIRTPSGGKLSVEYESDDYGYVQNKQATQMFKILRLGVNAHGSGETSPIYTTTDGFSDDGLASLRVYFKLEKPLLASEYTTSMLRHKAVYKYIEDIDQLYFNVKMDLKKNNDNIAEFVSGYADIDKSTSNPEALTNVNPTTEDIGGNDYYTEGFITLKLTRMDGDKKQYHPFSLAAWQYLRTNFPEIAYTGSNSVNPPTTFGQRMGKVKDLLGAFQNFRQLFGNYYKICNSKEWASRFFHDYAWIRLNSPDKIKYGGGNRVKKVAYSDEWNFGDETASEYGQVYEYTNMELIDNKTVTISSGVAQYEPFVGGDENAMRSAKIYPGAIKTKGDNNLFFEYPINESIYPSPVVGYSKVTVKSLARALQEVPNSNFKEISSTGMVVHEFYTAKDFPIISKETKNDIVHTKIPIPLPLIGGWNEENITASQGYLTELNDMHGKPRKVTNYGYTIDPNLSATYKTPIVPEATGYVEYFYKSKPTMINGKMANQLVSSLPVLTGDGIAPVTDREIGVEYDFYTDQRYYKSSAVQGGAHINNEQLLFIPAFVPWPSVGSTVYEMRLAVTNKIIHRTGLVSHTVAGDGQSIVQTDNLYYDAITGQPLVTKVKNNFEDDIFSYNLPAHWAYEGMGPAYHNLGVKVGAITYSASTGKLTGFSAPQAELFFPGDEVVFTSSGVTPVLHKGYITGVNKDYNELSVAFEASTPGNITGTIHIVRSGRRNHLSQTVGNYVTMVDPILNREASNCYANLNLPGTISAQYTLVISNQFIVLVDFLNELVTTNSDGIGPVDFYETSYVDVTGYASYAALQNLVGTLNFDKYFLNNGIPSIGSPARPLFIPCTYKQGNTIYWEAADFDNSPPILYFDKPTVVSPNAHTSPITLQINYSGSLKEKVVICGSTIGNLSLTHRKPNSTYVPNNTNEIIPYWKIDKVLQASATTMCDAWPQDFYNVRFTSNQADILQDMRESNPYATGEKGIWRTQKNYVYLDDRKGFDPDNLEGQPVNISEDGTFDDVAVFNYKNPLFTECVDEWLLTNEVTKYSPYGYELENRDILGRYSSALYGYGGKMVTVVAKNAAHNEIGFESFEEYEVGGDPVTNYTNTTGNLGCYTETQSEHFYFYKKVKVTGTGNLAIVEDDCITNIQTGRIAKIVACKIPSSGTPNKSEQVISFSNIVSYSNTSNGNCLLQLSPTAPGFCEDNATTNWEGEIYVPVEFGFSLANFSYPASISNDYAHTGKKSLKITGEQRILLQPLLDVKPGREYWVSAWVKTDVTALMHPLDAINYLSSFKLGATWIPNLTISTVGYKPLVIDGWVKLEGKVTIPSTSPYQYFYLSIPAFSFAGNTHPTYIDDIRIQPYNSSLTSYVYDPVTLRLTAVLDDNNCAAYYSYDEQGQLFLVKKETEKGIMTIQESRSNMVKE